MTAVDRVLADAGGATGVDVLEELRRRTLALLEPVPDAELLVQHSRIMSPLVWDLAHVGHYEELWVLRAVGGMAATDPLYDDVYDAFRHPRPTRPSLPLLPPHEARAYLVSVRERALDVLAAADLSPAADDPLRAGGAVIGLVAQHEAQHAETMLATLQLRAAPYEGIDLLGLGPRPGSGGAAGVSAPLPADVLVPGGPCEIGVTADPWAYDNERPARVVDVPPFRIDTVPVTNAAYRSFVEAGGYRDARLWHPDGWALVQSDGLQHPGTWVPDGAGGWGLDRFGRIVDLPGDEPVQHVCWYEADAFARWHGSRLPTEVEWEKAASHDPATGVSRPLPWGDGPAAGRANLGWRRPGPAPVGSLPLGASSLGVHQMLGDVWEWTSSDLEGHAGFTAFPYREYSEVFFGSGYKVLRGGSWATHPCAARTTFRNWDLPIRRQIFAGFRCARDA